MWKSCSQCNPYYLELKVDYFLYPSLERLKSYIKLYSFMGTQRYRLLEERSCVGYLNVPGFVLIYGKEKGKIKEGISRCVVEFSRYRLILVDGFEFYYDPMKTNEVMAISMLLNQLYKIRRKGGLLRRIQEALVEEDSGLALRVFKRCKGDVRLKGLGMLVSYQGTPNEIRKRAGIEYREKRTIKKRGGVLIGRIISRSNLRINTFERGLVEHLETDRVPKSGLAYT